eukprot:TRINITY_DN1389_c6_g1_i1.p1 TRINITY_DN1389_c6_g1~~TRINITY_DN1389_c6_g1_i1.p1  ORF type:complete len:655 (+),score=96.41 TRINITY_DN1389_c6_g1_i1:13-1977(+)
MPSVQMHHWIITLCTACLHIAIHAEVSQRCHQDLFKEGVCGVPDSGAWPLESLEAEDTTLLQLPKSKSVGSTIVSDVNSVYASVVRVNKFQPEFAEPRRSARTALCFSGGGGRSLTLSMGYYRALVSLGILPSGVDAISSVSGGTWASAQYMFADRTSEQLVGNPSAPENLTMQELNNTPPDMGATLLTDTNELAERILKVGSVKCLASPQSEACYKKLLSRLWIDVMGATFLHPYGLDSSKYMASSQKAVEQIVADNPSLHAKQFVTPMPDRPTTFVMNGGLGAPEGYRVGHNGVSLQMSPDFIGSPFYPNCSSIAYRPAVNFTAYGALFNQSTELLELTVGGGLISAFAFGSEAPAPALNDKATPGKIEKITVPAPSTPFTLSDAVGISSAAFAKAAAVSVETEYIDPKGLYWSLPHDEDQHQRRRRRRRRRRHHHQQQQYQDAQEYTMFDGGDLENLGVLAMLQSKVRRLAVFVNTATPLNATMDLCSKDNADLTHAATIDLSCLFGYCTDGASISWNYMKDQVFKKCDYHRLLCKFQTEKQAGRSSVAFTKLKTVENKWWGIPGGREVDIIWVYNEKVDNFEQRLPEETKAEIAKGDSGPFANFPWYLTTFENPPYLTKMYANQVNLLAAQAEFSILEHKDIFCKLFACK